MRLDKLTQERRVLDALLESKGQWVNKQFFVRELWLTQAGRAIWNLENQPHWKDALARMNVRIEHSDFTDEHSFKSYRVVSTVPAGQLFNVAAPVPKQDAGRWAG